MQKDITSTYIVKRDQLDHIAKSVKKKRLNKKMTQTQLAEASGISTQYISGIETYRLAAVNKDTLSRIAKALKTERRELIGRPPRHQEHDHDTKGKCDDELIPLPDNFYTLDSEEAPIIKAYKKSLSQYTHLLIINAVLVFIILVLVLLWI